MPTSSIAAGEKIMRHSTVLAIAVTLIIAMAIVVPGNFKSRSEDTPPRELKVADLVKKGLGEKTVAIVSGPTRVEALRLAAQERPGDADRTITNGKLRWLITASGKESSKEFTAKLQGLILDAATAPEEFDEKEHS